MTALLLLATFQSVASLNQDVLWYDELFAVANMGGFEGQFAPDAIIASLRQFAPDHVPLYYLLGSAWAQMAGWSQTSLRYLSLLFGLLMLAGLYRFTADAFDKRAGLVTAALISSNAFVIWYFHELRAYTFLMTLCIMHCWIYWRIAAGAAASRRLWLCLVLSCAALLYTHTSALVLLAGLGACHLLFAPRTRAWKAVFAGWMAGGLTFLPYLPSLLDRDFAHGSSQRAAPLAELVLSFGSILVNGQLWLWLPLILALAYAVRRDRKKALTPLLTVALVMSLALALANWQFDIIPITRIRYLLILMWIVIVIFGVALASLPRWKLAAFVFILLWAMAGLDFTHSGRILEYAGFTSFYRRYPPLHRYTDQLLGRTRQGDFLLGFTAEDWVNRDGQLSPHGYGSLDYYLGLRLGIDGRFIDINLRPWQIERDANAIIDARPRLLLAQDPGQHQSSAARVEAVLEAALLPCATLVDTPDLQIQRYAHPLLGCEHEPASITFEDGIRVIDRAARHDPERQIIETLLWWELPNEDLRDQFNFSLQIIDRDGQNLRQVDHHLAGDQLPWGVNELSTADLPPGDYQLVLIVYNRETLRRLSGLDPRGANAAEMLGILSFNIAAD